MEFLHHQQQSAIRDLIVKSFNLDEIETMCADLGIPYEDLAGSTLTSKARELCAYAHKHSQVEELISYCANKRPNVRWWNIWNQKELKSPQAEQINSAPATVSPFQEKTQQAQPIQPSELAKKHGLIPSRTHSSTPKSSRQEQNQPERNFTSALVIVLCTQYVIISICYLLVFVLFAKYQIYKPEANSLGFTLALVIFFCALIGIRGSNRLRKQLKGGRITSTLMTIILPVLQILLWIQTNSSFINDLSLFYAYCALVIGFSIIVMVYALVVGGQEILKRLRQS